MNALKLCAQDFGEYAMVTFNLRLSSPDNLPNMY